MLEGERGRSLTQEGDRTPQTSLEDRREFTLEVRPQAGVEEGVGRVERRQSEGGPEVRTEEVAEPPDEADVVRGPGTEGREEDQRHGRRRVGRQRSGPGGEGEGER